MKRRTPSKGKGKGAAVTPTSKKTSTKATAKRADTKRSRIQASPAGQHMLKELRGICLELPDTTEVEAWGHPTFRVNNKIFAGFGADEAGATLGVKTTPDMQAALVSSDPRFTIAAYVGKHGWVSMKLEGKIDWDEVAALVRGSYKLVAPPKLAAMVD